MKRRILVAPVLILLLLSQTACPSKSDLDKAAKASNELSHDVLTAEKVVGTLYTSGKITLAKKDFYAEKLKLISVNGQKFNNALIRLDKKYPEGTLPPESLQFLRDNWKTVAEPFADLLGDLNLFGLGSAVKDLKKDVNTIEKVVR